MILLDFMPNQKTPPTMPDPSDTSADIPADETVQTPPTSNFRPNQKTPPPCNNMLSPMASQPFLCYDEPYFRPGFIPPPITRRHTYPQLHGPRKYTFGYSSSDVKIDTMDLKVN